MTVTMRRTPEDRHGAPRRALGESALQAGADRPLRPAAQGHEQTLLGHLCGRKGVLDAPAAEVRDLMPILVRP